MSPKEAPTGLNEQASTSETDRLNVSTTIPQRGVDKLHALSIYDDQAMGECISDAINFGMSEDIDFERAAIASKLREGEAEHSRKVSVALNRRQVDFLWEEAAKVDQAAELKIVPSNFLNALIDAYFATRVKTIDPHRLDQLRERYNF